MDSKNKLGITWSKKFEFQSSVNYFAPRITTQGEDLASYSIDLGLSKDILKGKGTLTAGVRDLLNTRLRRSIVDNEGYYSNSEFQRRARQFTVTFTYHLNSEKEKKPKERMDDDEDD